MKEAKLIYLPTLRDILDLYLVDHPKIKENIISDIEKKRHRKKLGYFAPSVKVLSRYIFEASGANLARTSLKLNLMIAIVDNATDELNITELDFYENMINNVRQIKVRSFVRDILTYIVLENEIKNKGEESDYQSIILPRYKQFKKIILDKWDNDEVLTKFIALEEQIRGLSS